MGHKPTTIHAEKPFIQGQRLGSPNIKDLQREPGFPKCYISVECTPVHPPRAGQGLSEVSKPALVCWPLNPPSELQPKLSAVPSHDALLYPEEVAPEVQVSSLGRSSGPSQVLKGRNIFSPKPQIGYGGTFSLGQCLGKTMLLVAVMLGILELLI